MKKIIIVYRNDENEPAIACLNQIVEEIFDGYAKIEICFADRLTPQRKLNADLFLVIDRKLLPILREHTDELKNVVIMERSINRDKLKELLAIPQGSRVLVVNDTRENAEEMIYMLYELGIGHLRLIPYVAEQSEEYVGIEYAITPDEVPTVPTHIKNVINTGYRMISFDAISKIADLIGLEEQEVAEKMIKYGGSVVTPSREFQTSYLDNFLKSRMLSTYAGDSLFAILLADKDGRLLYCNHKAQKIFSGRINLNKSTADELDANLQRLLQSGEEFNQQLVTIDRHNFMVDRYNLKLGNVSVGFYLVLKDETEIAEMEQSLNKKLVEKGLFAKHSFRDIQQNSASMEECINMAKTAALSGYTVLINGESGTGKELIAQAIHNYSQRKNRPFVGVNCAAIPENLLESELFGYVGGAFTGADKNGKIGYFERANHGTIFLDEIGDVSPAMQAKLLRAIQERQIMRVGSDRVIDLDVRIIAATNKDLLAAVQTGTFREDLYYRLNVLQVKVPPLRERKGDVAVLLRYFLGDEFERLTKEERNLLKRYKWPGNVRELENCALYYKTLGKLPDTILRETAAEAADMHIDTGLKNRIAVLNILKKTSPEGQGLGRTAIYEKLSAAGMKISDIRLRGILEELKNEGMIEICAGRKGTSITAQGIRYLREQTETVD